MWAPLSCRCNATAWGSMNRHILQSWTALRSFTHINTKHVYLNSADFHWAGKDSVIQAQYYLVPTDANNTLNDSNCRESFLMFLVVPELKLSLTQTFLQGEKFKNIKVLFLQKWAVFSNHSKWAGTSTAPFYSIWALRALIYLRLRIGSISKWTGRGSINRPSDFRRPALRAETATHNYGILSYIQMFLFGWWTLQLHHRLDHTVLNFNVV